MPDPTGGKAPAPKGCLWLPHPHRGPPWLDSGGGEAGRVSREQGVASGPNGHSLMALLSRPGRDPPTPHHAGGPGALRLRRPRDPETAARWRSSEQTWGGAAAPGCQRPPPSRLHFLQQPLQPRRPGIPAVRGPGRRALASAALPGLSWTYPYPGWEEEGASDSSVAKV